MRIPHARILAGLMAAALLTAAMPAHSRPKIRDSFFMAYPTAVGTRLDNVPSNPGHCGVCHYDFNGGGTRNLYGQRVEAAINQSPACSGNDTNCLKTRILGIQNEDSDGDGHTQLTEITSTSYSNTPTFPGLTPANVNNVTNVVLAEIQGYLVPTVGGDTQPPLVTVNAPNGGENWTGGSSHNVTWSATDNVGVVAVDVYFRDAESAPWKALGRNLANTGLFLWFVHDMPGATTRVRVVARDAAGNQGEDVSNSLFTIVKKPGGIVPTSLRDFEIPGTQPLEGGTFDGPNLCLNCHGGYDSAVEPGHNFKGMMMGQSARDPIFHASLAVAEQDAPGAGDLCLRCHSPFGWLGGRSQPTGGQQLTAFDREGMACDFCHRAVDPVYKPGVSPPEDQAVLNGLLPAHRPAGYSNGQYVMDPLPRKRGPFADPVAPHAFLTSPFHTSSDVCGTCHDVSNPAFDRVGASADYVPGPLDAAPTTMGSHVLMPLERTYSEWKNSAYPAGVYAPEFAGNKPGGMVSSCQDCHLRDVSGKGCSDPLAPLRPDLPLHDMMGGNSWMGPIINTLYPSETDAAALVAGAQRAVSMLSKAATIDVTMAPANEAWVATVTVTNRTGHKLPTGYPEGRRMWLQVAAYDLQGQKIYESGAYDPATGVLTHDPDIVVYETHLGISPGLAAALGQSPGTSFHFALNDTVYMDNRIPPLGFTHAAFAAFGGAPVDDSRPAPRYADGQNWDVSAYLVPAATAKVVARLYYQTTSKEFVEFLRDQNTTNGTGQTMYNVWAANGKAAPVLVATDSSNTTVDVPWTPPGGHVALTLARNPFVGSLEMRLALPEPGPVRLVVIDARGRKMVERPLGVLAAGTHTLRWDGRDARGADAGAGVFWARIEAVNQSIVRQVVRLR